METEEKQMKKVIYYQSHECPYCGYHQWAQFPIKKWKPDYGRPYRTFGCPKCKKEMEDWQ